MSTDREERIRLLLRKGARSRELPPFKQKLMSATGLPEDSFNFLSLEESDQQIDEYHKIYDELSSAQKCIVTWEEPDPVKQVLTEIALLAEPSELHIYFPDSDTLGVLPMASSLFFPHAFQFLNAAGDCIHAVSQEYRSGLTLDFYEEGRTGVTYEIVGWGTYRSLLEKSIAKLFPEKLISRRAVRSQN